MLKTLGWYSFLILKSNSNYLMIRILLLCTVFAFGCNSGKIPCPKVKKVRLQRSAHLYKPDFIANADYGIKKSEKNSKPEKKIKIIQHVSVEEWDCPKPGTFRYMPKAIKHNIKRNFRKINSEADSLVEHHF